MIKLKDSKKLFIIFGVTAFTISILLTYTNFGKKFRSTNSSKSTQVSPTPGIPFDEAYQDLTYKSYGCQNTTQDFTNTPFEIYTCKISETGYPTLSTILKFKDNKVLELSTASNSPFGTNYSALAQTNLISDDFYGVSYFSGGNHCCTVVDIVDAKNEKITSSFTLGYEEEDEASFYGKIGSESYLFVEYLEFESFAGGNIGDRSNPTLYVTVDKTGQARITNKNIPASELDEVLKNYDQSLTELPSDQKIKNLDDICEEYFENTVGAKCMVASTEMRIVGAKTAQLLFSGKTKEAEDFFYSKAHRTPANQMLYEKIMELTTDPEAKVIKNY